ncbi:MAG: NAD-dependent epimerase/dehydratase family protein [Proteobacteria bacterium]|nr:NAD-dependent epimerase/dehydratase family protein [Pseudomonadota bacterium]
MKKILITGGCGFIGAHFVEHFLKETDWQIIVLDKLSYASNGFDRLRDIECFPDKQARVKVFPVDLCLPMTVGIKTEIGDPDYIINLASESHVDNSITDPAPFIQNNVNLMLNLLEWALRLKGLKRFIQFSTDEVYGPAPEGIEYREGDRFNPGNPYSASKAAQEAICMAYANTYSLPITITNTMNVFGERQHPEKFIPLVIKKVLNRETITIHADSTRTKAGTRFYIHARTVANAVHFILDRTGETLSKDDAEVGKFHIVGEREIDNLTLALMIADHMGEELRYELVDFHSSRPGHDLRYALSGEKLASFGWHTPINFNESLGRTVEWTLGNQRWLGELDPVVYTVLERAFG